MSRGGLRFVLLCGAVALACVVASDAQAQLKFDRGQNVAPVFEGWERNPDGTFNMVFGYMNRNYREMPHVPVGLPGSTCGASSSSSACRCPPTGATRTWSGR